MHWVIPEQHSYQLQTWAPWWPCGFPALRFSCPPHCTVYVTSEMKGAHGRLQDLVEARRCGPANIKLTTELNSPACSVPFHWHSVGSRNILLTWHHHIQRSHINAALFQKAKDLLNVSWLQIATVASTISISTQNSASHTDRHRLLQGSSLGALEMAKRKLCKESKESRGPAEWDKPQKTV